LRAQTELPLFHAAPGELRVALKEVDPDELSPQAALDTLYRLRKVAG